MRCIRIVKPDGTASSRSLDIPRINIGRDADNDLVLDDPAVSRYHCLLEIEGGQILVKDRGTGNGTFLNNGPLTEPRTMVEGDRLYVGPFLLELVSIAPERVGATGGGRPLGPLVRLPDAGAPQSRRRRRLDAWANEWDIAGRPGRMLLQGRLLRDALVLVAESTEVEPTTRSFVVRSRRRARRRRIGLAVGGVGSVAALAVVAINGVPTLDAPPVEAGADEEVAAVPVEDAVAVVAPSAVEEAAPEIWIDHTVIPAESLEDIARRYDVSVANVARWNSFNPDDPEITVGGKVRVRPKKNPLPQQQVEFELDRDYDWKSLSKRFDVEIEKLRAYNPEIDELDRGQRIVVWINPQPYGRRADAFEVPEYDSRDDALSIGRPNDGRLEHGIQMPPSDLYERRAPFIMYGSSHTIETLQKAIAHFRRDLAWDGVLVLADISRRKGGNFYPPHRSHQAGRDIDIWMPTLKGVYKRNFLGRDRKPKPNEIDWFATWGLVRALVETEQIVHIFLEYELQAKLHHAAKMMGATEEELRAAMQYPRGQFASGIVGHSAGHNRHIHVRLKCGPNDTACFDNISRRAEE